MTSGHYTGMKGLFSIYPPTSPTPFTVWCEMLSDGKTFVMKNFISRTYVEFNRTWEEYKDGFGDMSSIGNFWLGNERLYYLTNHRPMSLRLRVSFNQENLTNSKWNFRQRVYSEFKVRRYCNCEHSKAGRFQLCGYNPNTLVYTHLPKMHPTSFYNKDFRFYSRYYSSETSLDSSHGN